MEKEINEDKLFELVDAYADHKDILDKMNTELTEQERADNPKYQYSLGCFEMAKTGLDAMGFEIQDLRGTPEAEELRQELQNM